MGDRYLRESLRFIHRLQRFFGMRIAGALNGFFDMVNRFFQFRDSVLGGFDYLGMIVSFFCQRDSRLQAETQYARENFDVVPT